MRTHYAAGNSCAVWLGQPNAPSLPRTLPDPRSLFLGQAISFSVLPEPMLARRADPRAWVNSARRWNYGDDLTCTCSASISINRWRLEKAGSRCRPLGAQATHRLTVDRNVPALRYREAVTRGVLRWNAAPERIGFRDAIQVNQRPDDADWSTDGSQPSLDQVVPGVDNLAAIGPSLVDHRSGEILDGDILITDFWTCLPRAELIRDIHPDARPAGPRAPISQPRRRCHVRHARPAGSSRKRSRSDSPEAEAYVQDTLSAAVVDLRGGPHLGADSTTSAPPAPTRWLQLRDPDFVARYGIAASVMGSPAAPMSHRPASHLRPINRTC
ncbi:MAG: hypothetical protein IPN40_06970 [Uliginosibacterium sp.]|nr:hypothetical protein [Uliginosibacterium sp.]